MIGAADSTVMKLLVMREFETRNRRIKIKEAGVVVLVRFRAHHARCPQLGPTTIFLVVSARVHLPQFARPESSSPEEPFLGLPFPGLVVAICEESIPGVGS